MSNITKDGNIRTKKTCPFLKRCSQVKADCPKRGNVKPTQYKCGVARLFAAADARRKSLPVVEIVETVKPIEVWNVQTAVEVKRAERFKADTWIPQSVIARA
jgi:hypothetical protein